MKNKLILLLTGLGLLISSCEEHLKYAVVISANSEWKSIKNNFTGTRFSESPWGEYFFEDIAGEKVLFFHQGWGKVSAAGGTQYVIDKFDPEFIINLGTCGGFGDSVKRYDIILANRTVIYDIKEAMGDSGEAIEEYSTPIDLSWLSGEIPQNIHKTVLVSADRDIVPSEIPDLKASYNAVAGDWESGAIAYVANRNSKKVLILRGVSDMVSTEGGEVYGDFELFRQRCDSVMTILLNDLPGWIDRIENDVKKK